MQPFRPSPQPELVAYLEQVLERARAGEVGFFVCSAGVVPAGEAASLAVLAYAALGSRVVRWDPASRSAAYASTLEGLTAACKILDEGMGPLKAKVLE